MCKLAWVGLAVYLVMAQGCVEEEVDTVTTITHGTTTFTTDANSMRVQSYPPVSVFIEYYDKKAYKEWAEQAKKDRQGVMFALDENLFVETIRIDVPQEVADSCIAAVRDIGVPHWREQRAAKEASERVGRYLDSLAVADSTELRKTIEHIEENTPKGAR